MKLVLKIQVTVVFKELVSKIFTTYQTLLRVICGSKCQAYVEQICIVDSCNLNLRNVTQHLKHLEPTARLTTTDM